MHKVCWAGESPICMPSQHRMASFGQCPNGTPLLKSLKRRSPGFPCVQLQFSCLSLQHPPAGMLHGFHTLLLPDGMCLCLYWAALNLSIRVKERPGNAICLWYGDLHHSWPSLPLAPQSSRSCIRTAGTPNLLKESSSFLVLLISLIQPCTSPFHVLP